MSRNSLSDTLMTFFRIPLLLLQFTFITCFVSWSGALLSISPRRNEPASCRDCSQLVEQSGCCAKYPHLQSRYCNSCVPCCCHVVTTPPTATPPPACHHHGSCRPLRRVSDPGSSLRMSQRAAQWEAKGFWEEDGKLNWWYRKLRKVFVGLCPLTFPSVSLACVPLFNSLYA